MFCAIFVRTILFYFAVVSTTKFRMTVTAFKVTFITKVNFNVFRIYIIIPRIIFYFFNTFWCINAGCFYMPITNKNDLLCSTAKSQQAVSTVGISSAWAKTMLVIGI